MPILHDVLAWAHSALVCRGTHTMSSLKTVFLIDPNGPDRYTGIPPGSVIPGPPYSSFSNPGPTLDRGWYESFHHCIRCGLRDDGKGYEL